MQRPAVMRAARDAGRFALAVRRNLASGRFARERTARSFPANFLGRRDCDEAGAQADVGGCSNSGLLASLIQRNDDIDEFP